MQTLTPVRQPEHESTVDEGWMLRPVSPSNHYTAAVDFALRTLGPGSGRRCLVIGSPLFEAWALQSTGWNVMYLDVRRPPLAAGKQVLGDAIQLPFASQSFDAVSTTCVLCHVGLGRYGDAVESNGDDLALGEIARVMRVKALAAIMFGPSHPGIAVTYVLGSTHRIYSPTQAVRQAIAVDQSCGGAQDVSTRRCGRRVHDL